MCRPPTKFISFPFREREQFLSGSRLHRRERCGDIFKAFALGVDAEEPSHETPENHHDRKKGSRLYKRQRKLGILRND
jgi:hypothetical protein